MTKEDLIYAQVEVKTPVILYEDENGVIDKFYFHESNSFTHDEASDILNGLGIKHKGIIRVIAERVVLEINRLHHQEETILSTETYYNKRG